MAGDSRRANWRSKRRCDYYQRRRLTFRVLALDSRVQEIMINGDIEERLPTRTIRDMITCFADHLPRSWWEKSGVDDDGKEIPVPVVLDELADFDGIARWTCTSIFASDADVQHWANWTEFQTN